MSKKSRRQRTPNLPPEAFNAPQAMPAKGAAPAVATSNAAAAGAALKPAAQSDAVNWKAEYGDVLGDLKRTAIIAAALLAAMVVLSFVIR